MSTFDTSARNPNTLYSRRSRIFLRRGPAFVSSAMSTRFSGGGGVVAVFFRDLQNPMRFSGGGVVAEFFRDLQNPMTFSGGGVVAEFFVISPKPYEIQWGGVVAEMFRELR